MADEAKKLGPRKKYITQPCRLPLGNGNFAEVTIRVPEECAESVRWEFTNETVLISTVVERAIESRPPSAPRPPVVLPSLPRAIAPTAADEGEDQEIRDAVAHGATEEDVEAILAARAAAGPSLRLASDRGAEIARAAAGLRTIKVTVDGEDVEQELSASGGVAR